MFQNENIYLFLLILPIISFLYASIGHGGASGYLALMTLFSFAPETIRPTALLLNIFVAAISFYYYNRAGYFNKKLFFAFAISSIPMAFIGGLITVDTYMYKKTLAVLLIFAILKILNVFNKENTSIKEIKYWKSLIIGAIVGFFSGLIGIGGGIILSPIILLFHWGRMKEAAAVSALFILVNSVAGLLGQLNSGIVLNKNSFLLVIIAIVGSVMGGYLGSKKINNYGLRYILSFVLVTACVKLFLS